VKVLITGSESFVGKELICQCKEREIEIIGIDIIEKENSDFEYHRISIISPEIIKIFPDNLDAIIHLAALSRDPDCKGKAYECFENNVMGTLNLIKVAKIKKVKQFIFASSEWVYDEFKENQSKNEEYPINSLSLTSEYALSKLTSEINLKQQYQNGFCDTTTSEINLKQQYINGFCSTTILRFGIIYGPRKNNWSAVETIASQIKNNDEIKVGSLKNGRRFIHISDISRGIIKSIGLKGFHTINLSGDKIITIKDLIENCEEVFNKKIRVIENNPDEQNIRNPDNSKAKEILGWSTKIDLKEGLKSIEKFL
jgi:nucleoside-diphosphate-sugar epimerase